MSGEESVGDKRQAPDDPIQLDKARSKPCVPALGIRVGRVVQEFRRHIEYFINPTTSKISSIEFSGQHLDPWLTETCDRIQKLSKKPHRREQVILLRNINLVYNATMFEEEFQAEAAEVSNLIEEMSNAMPGAKSAAAEASAQDPVFSDADIAATAAEEQYVLSQALLVVEEIPVVPFVIARWFCARHKNAYAAKRHILSELFHYNTDPQNYLVVTSFLGASTPSGNPDDAKLSRDFVALVLMFKDFQFDDVVEFINKMGHPETPLSEEALKMQMARLQGVGAERMAELEEIAAGTQTPAPQLSEADQRALLSDRIAARVLVLQQARNLLQHPECDISEVQTLLAIVDDPDCVNAIAYVSKACGCSHAEALRQLRADEFDVAIALVHSTAAKGSGAAGGGSAAGGSGASGGKGKERMGS